LQSRNDELIAQASSNANKSVKSSQKESSKEIQILRNELAFKNAEIMSLQHKRKRTKLSQSVPDIIDTSETKQQPKLECLNKLMTAEFIRCALKHNVSEKYFIQGSNLLTCDPLFCLETIYSELMANYDISHLIVLNTIINFKVDEVSKDRYSDIIGKIEDLLIDRCTLEDSFYTIQVLMSVISLQSNFSTLKLRELIISRYFHLKIQSASLIELQSIISFLLSLTRDNELLALLTNNDPSYLQNEISLSAMICERLSFDLNDELKIATCEYTLDFLLTIVQRQLSGQLFILSQPKIIEIVLNVLHKTIADGKMALYEKILIRTVLFLSELFSNSNTADYVGEHLYNNEDQIIKYFLYIKWNCSIKRVTGKMQS
jgi:hypothetical protein